MDLTQRKKTHKNLKGTIPLDVISLLQLKRVPSFFSLPETMLPGKSALFPLFLRPPPSPPLPPKPGGENEVRKREGRIRETKLEEGSVGASRSFESNGVCSVIPIYFRICREGIKVFQSCERDFFCGRSATTAFPRTVCR